MSHTGKPAVVGNASANAIKGSPRSLSDQLTHVRLDGDFLRVGAKKGESAQLLFPGPNRDFKPVLLGREGTDVFLVERTEGIVGSIEVDQCPSIRHRLNVEISPF